ncbi:hypothetical protein [Nocardioides jensenii]|uniref:hypothetical protein n=1 Tax=Nocardioides jensenii TaxID=1843 RepID=UPI00082E6A3B|nr:hypothetical protein [Nocardioides jensenii]
MARVAIPETPTTKALVAAICSYEVAAIVTRRFPTVTAFHRRWPAVGIALLGALAIHFFTPDPSTTVPRGRAHEPR